MPNDIRNENLVDITPDVRLFRVLRNSGFHMQTAMGELLDNSLDAGANEINVSVFINNRKKKNIMIMDNGKGMNESTLRYSLTMAKELKVGIDQLGKYGMGMKTAALSISTQFEILTKKLSGEVLYGEFNINKMEQLGEYKTVVRVATKEEETFFHDKLGKRRRSGTILIVKNCDRFEGTFSSFIKKMEVFIGLTYKNYLNKGVSFTVSCDTSENMNNLVKPIDPLIRENDLTYVVTERETFPIEYHNSNGQKKTSFIEISASVLPKPDSYSKGRVINGQEISLPINQTNQGVYFYREGRMVGQALYWNNVFGEKHNSKNRLRIEINCKSELDEEIRMNFQKGNVSPTTFLKNQLAEIIEPVMIEMKEKLKSEEDKGLDTKDEMGSKDKPSVAKRRNKMEVEFLLEKDEKNPPENGRLRKARPESLDELLQTAKKIKSLLENEQTPENIKNKLREALGLVVETV